MNTDVQISFQVPAFNSFGCIPRSGSAGSYSQHFFKPPFIVCLQCSRNWVKHLPYTDSFNIFIHSIWEVELSPICSWGNKGSKRWKLLAPSFPSRKRWSSDQSSDLLPDSWPIMLYCLPVASLSPTVCQIVCLCCVVSLSFMLALPSFLLPCVGSLSRKTVFSLSGNFENRVKALWLLEVFVSWKPTDRVLEFAF